MTNLDDILADYETSGKPMGAYERAHDDASMGAAAFVVEAGDEQALVDVGWDDQGVTIDVRVFVDREQVPPAMSEFFGIAQVRATKED